MLGAVKFGLSGQLPAQSSSFHYSYYFSLSIQIYRNPLRVILLGLYWCYCMSSAAELVDSRAGLTGFNNSYLYKTGLNGGRED